MKKVLNLTLAAMLTLSCIFTSTQKVYANDKTSPLAYTEYYNILNKLINGDPNNPNDSGIGIYTSTNTDEMILDSSKTNKGLVSAELIDFDNDGDNELFYVYLSGNDGYTYKVLGYESNKIINLLSGTIPFGYHWSSSNSISLVSYNNQTFLKLINGYYHGGDYIGESKYEFISFSNNVAKIETILFEYNPTESQRQEIIDGYISEEETYKYKYILNNKEKSISSEEFNNILSKYSNNEKIYLEESSSCFYSDLDLRYENINTINSFLFELLNKSYQTSFKNAKDILSNADYVEIENYLNIFTEFNQYDKVNLDKNQIVNFIFDLYLYSSDDNQFSQNLVTIISGEKTEGSELICSLPINVLKSTIYEIFGINLEFKENEQFNAELFSSPILYTVENNVLVRKGNYNIYRDCYGINREIKNIYQIKDNYYLVDLNEIVFESGEEYFTKFNIILEKLDNGKFNLIKLQKDTMTDDEINLYVSSLSKNSISKIDSVTSSKVNSSNTLSSSSIILISVSMPVVLILCILLFVKFSSITIPLYITITLIASSLLLGVGTYYFLNNKYTTSISKDVSTLDENTITENIESNSDTKPEVDYDSEIEIENDIVPETNNENVDQNNNQEHDIEPEDLSTEPVKEEEKEDIGITLDNMLNDYVYAVEIGDSSIMHKYVTINGKAYKDYEKNIPSFYNDGITIESLDYEILDLKREPNGDFRLSYSTSFEVTNPNGKRYQEEIADFIIVYNDDSREYLIDRLENWKITHKEDI